MENELLAKLGDHIDLLNEQPNIFSNPSGEDTSINVARRLTFVLFKEIVETSPLQTREEVFNPEGSSEDQELLNSIKRRGIINPIIIRELPDGKASGELVICNSIGERKYALVAGHRRVAAGLAAGLSGAEGVILKPGEDPDLVTLTENIGRKELSTYERAQGLSSFRERTRLSIRQIANETGYSKTQVHRLLTAQKAPALLKKIWKDQDMSASAVVYLKNHWAHLEESPPEKIEQALRSLTKCETQDLANQLDAEIPFDQAVKVIKARKATPDSVLKPADPNIKKTQIPEIKLRLASENRSFKSLEKEKIIKAIRHVFPRPRLEKVNSLFDLAIASNEKNLDVFWAAALYVSRGGDVNNAIPDCKSAMKNRSFRALMKRELKNMKQAAALYKTKKQDKKLKKTIRICFPGI